MNIRSRTAIFFTLMLLVSPLHAQEAALSKSDLTKLLIPKGPAKTFKEHLVKTQVSDAVLKVLDIDTAPDTKPFIMLNLVRFRPHRDPTLYMRYGATAGPRMEDQGSFVGYNMYTTGNFFPIAGGFNSAGMPPLGA